MKCAFLEIGVDEHTHISELETVYRSVFKRAPITIALKPTSTLETSKELLTYLKKKIQMGKISVVLGGKGSCANLREAKKSLEKQFVLRI